MLSIFKYIKYLLNMFKYFKWVTIKIPTFKIPMIMIPEKWRFDRVCWYFDNFCWYFDNFFVGIIGCLYYEPCRGASVGILIPHMF